MGFIWENTPWEIKGPSPVASAGERRTQFLLGGWKHPDTEGDWGYELPETETPENAELISDEKVSLKILFRWTRSINKSHPRKVIQGTTCFAFPKGLVPSVHPFPHTWSNMTTLRPLHCLGTAFSRPLSVPSTFATCKDTHSHPGPSPLSHR